MGNTIYSPGEVAQGFEFDGDGDGVLVGSAPNLQLQDFTIEAWIRRSSTNLVSTLPGDDGLFFGYGTLGYGFGLDRFGGHPFLTWIDIDSLIPISGIQITDTNWHHLAVTKSGVNVVFYVDGAAHPAVPYNRIFSFNTPAAVGARGDNFTGSFRGGVDELAIFNRALSAAEIQAIHSAGVLGMGKCGLTTPPTNCLPFAAQVIVDGITNVFTALTTNWVTNTFNFVATQTNTLAAFNALGANSGLWLDTISFRQVAVVTQGFYLTFTENTNRASAPIKFASLPFNIGVTTTNFISGFEPAAATNYVAPEVVDGWDVLSTNRVSVPGDPLQAHTGTNSLALLSGEIQRTLPTFFGRDYRLDFAYRAVTNLNPISWWPADNNAIDVVDGNHGTLVSNAVYSVGRVGQTFVFDGDRDGVLIGNATNLHLQDFSIEGWIRRSSTTNASFNGNGNGTIFGIGTGGGGYGFWVEQSDNSLALGLSQGTQVNSPPQTLADTNWHHVAVTKLGANVAFYIDGVAYAAGPFNPGPFTFAAPGFIGAWLNPFGQIDNSFYGAIDELAVYDRILTAAEVRDIYAAGAAGKCGTTTPPSLCPLTGARVLVPGLATNTFTGTTNWQTNSVSFTAPASGTPVTLSTLPGGQSGVLLDTFTLTEFPGSVYYLPEETLASLVNENAFGLWRLEILDTRTGAINKANLLGWQLQFVYQTEIPFPEVLTHGEPKTNTIPAGQTAYYIVDVPAWAQFATNTLLFANPPPGVDVLFNQNQPPTNGVDLVLISGTSGNAVLSASSTPVLLPGQRYYLGVYNPGGAPVTFGIQVDFDITPLFDGVPVTGTLNTGALPRYFSYDVSTNATAVSYQLTNLNGNVELVARRGTPFPTLNSFDYGSFNPGLQDESIFVFTNSNPVNLGPGRWYLGVFNTDIAPVTYTIVANEYTNLFPFITLTNGIPYFSSSPGPAGAIDYYRYVVTGNVARAQFEINNASGDMTLVARKGLPLPNLGLFDYLSANPPPNDELIVLFTNSAPVALTTGDWFLGAVNVAGIPINYSIKATQWPVTGRPLVITDYGIVNGSFCLTWTSLPGAHYYVQGVTNISATTNYWQTVSPTITATDFTTTWCLALPSPYQFFRVVEGLALNSIIPASTITSIVHTNNTVELRWSGPVSASYQVQWTPTLAPPGWNTFTNVVTSPTGQFLFVDDGSQTAGLDVTRYYRLRVVTP